MFDAAVLTALRNDAEVHIRTRAQTKPVPIWIVLGPWAEGEVVCGGCRRW